MVRGLQGLENGSTALRHASNSAAFDARRRAAGPGDQPAAVPRPGAAGVALRPEEVAFLDAITCDARDLRQAEALYEKYGVVRLRKAAANADLLARQATSAGVVADAFGQKRREDRYTIHLRGDARKWQGDGTDSTDDSAGDAASRRRGGLAR